jgi:hypothetical protein
MGVKKIFSQWKKALTDGFEAVKLMDNTNVYSVIFSEGTQNIFMSSMWMKVLNPYTLVISGGNKLCVGNNITLSGLTRAVVGVVAGRGLIDKLGVDTTFGIAGFLGCIGMVLNAYVLTHSSLMSIYWLNLVWAVFTGLWNSCLETEWARSLVKQKREDANDARQVLNKLTGAFGPLSSIAVFYYVGGTSWTIPVLTSVMCVGTVMSVIPVALCFCFSRTHEVKQDCCFEELSEIEFTNGGRLDCQALTKASLDTKRKGPVHLTYPLNPDKKLGKLRVLTPKLRESKFILGKQVNASLKKPSVAVDESRAQTWPAVAPDARSVRFEQPAGSVQEYMDAKERVIIHFRDRARVPLVARIEEMTIYLNQDRTVDQVNSWLSFEMSPIMKSSNLKYNMCLRGVGKVFFRRSTKIEASELVGLKAELLDQSSKDLEGGKSESSLRSTSCPDGEKKSKINMNMANCIVFCDIMNAVGSGMSLKFMDLFLIQDYDISPVGLMSIAIVQNLSVVFLTPSVKALMKTMRARGMKGAIGVCLIWAASLFFLGLLCVPNQNFYVSVLSIIMMNSLSSCTKAYNRAKLVNSLPHNQIAKYMVWDSLNKANQGGIAVFGGTISHLYGYRGCFAVTWIILFVRWCVWTIYLGMRGFTRKVPVPAESPENRATLFRNKTEDFDTFDATDFDAEVAGELFDKPTIDEMLEEQERKKVPDNLMLVEEDDEDLQSEVTRSTIAGSPTSHLLEDDEALPRRGKSEPMGAKT